MLRLKLPAGTTYHWNPYSPKYYTILGAPLSPSASDANSADEGSLRDADEFDERSPVTSQRYLSIVSSPGVLSRANSGHFLPPAVTSIAEARQSGAAIIAQIRGYQSDSLVESQMSALSPLERDQVIEALLNDPFLAPDLCLVSRGNIIAQLLASAANATAANSDPRFLVLLQLILNNFDHLSFHQNGTIALIRIYEVAGPKFAQEVNAMAIDRFRTLALHQYGNFVVSRCLRDICASNFAGISEHAHRQLHAFISDPHVLNELATSKFGSHVLEAWTEHAPLDSFMKTAGAVVTDRMLLRAMGCHSVANYPLQGILRRLARVELHPFHHEVNEIANVLADSPYAVNIRKAARGQLSRKKEAATVAY